MADEELLSKVHGLGDLDLAALLCLMNREHCVISTEPGALNELVEELQLVVTETFNLRSTVVSLTADTTLDDFAAAILLPSSRSRSNSPVQTRAPAHDYFHSSLHPASHSAYLQKRVSALSSLPYLPSGTSTTSPQIANVILARDLDKAPKVVQIQALELLRTRRIFTRTSVQTAPKQFLFVAIIGASSGGEARLTEHLNDFFYLAHWHDPLDGFAHLEEHGSAISESEDEDRVGEGPEHTDSDASVVRRPSRTSTMYRDSSTPDPRKGGEQDSVVALIAESDITTLSLASHAVNIDVEILRYQMNLISFLRMHHAVSGGIVPQATKHFESLMRSMAVLHGLDFVTPALVVLALRKIYLHRIRIVDDPTKERSVQWGSEIAAVEQLLESIGPEEVMEDVIGMVDVPL